MMPLTQSLNKILNGVHMKRYILITSYFIAGLALLVPRADAQPGPDIERERLAQTGMKFLSISVDPRAAALADAFTARQSASASLFANPAGMAGMEGFAHVSLSQVEWFANFQYAAGSVAFNPAGGRFGTFGLSIMAADYGNFQATIRADNERGFLDVGTVSPSAMVLGLGYARELTDRFAVGGQVKFVRQALGESTMGFDEGGGRLIEDNAASTVAFDLGVLYNTGFRSLNFAISARNFSREVTYSEESFELPLTFRIGVAMDMLDLAPGMDQNHGFVLTVDAERPRDYAEQLHVGGEYSFMNLFFLRGGYVFPTDEQGFNAGGGVRLSFGGLDLGADYAYSEFGRLGNVHRVGLNIGL